MIKENVGFFKYRKIIRESHNMIYHDKKTNRMIKLNRGSEAPDVSQIEYLSEKQRNVHKSYLPSGVLYYDFFPSGVIYPYYFEGYTTFENLYKEDEKIIFNNLRQALINNLELVKNNIRNRDLAFKNIMYKNDNVQLIDLDGKLIDITGSVSFSQMYQYFLIDLYHSLQKKTDLLYPNDSEVFKEIDSLFKIKYDEIDEYCPFRIIDEVEKKRILK